MNDWLTYKGSGSSRASNCERSNDLAHAGVINNFKKGGNASTSGYERLLSSIQKYENQALAIVDGVQKAANQISTGVTYLKSAQTYISVLSTKYDNLGSLADNLADSIEHGNLTDVQKSALLSRMKTAGDRVENKFNNLTIRYDTVGEVEDSLASALSNFKATR